MSKNNKGQDSEKESKEKQVTSDQGAEIGHIGSDKGPDFLDTVQDLDMSTVAASNQEATHSLPIEYYKANQINFPIMNDVSQVWDRNANPQIYVELTEGKKVLGQGTKAVVCYEAIDLETGAITLIPAWQCIKDKFEEAIQSGEIAKFIYILTYLGVKELKGGGTFTMVQLQKAPKLVAPGH